MEWGETMKRINDVLHFFQLQLTLRAYGGDVFSSSSLLVDSMIKFSQIS